MVELFFFADWTDTTSAVHEAQCTHTPQPNLLINVQICTFLLFPNQCFLNYCLVMGFQRWLWWECQSDVFFLQSEGTGLPMAFSSCLGCGEAFDCGWLLLTWACEISESRTSEITSRIRFVSQGLKLKKCVKNCDVSFWNWITFLVFRKSSSL